MLRCGPWGILCSRESCVCSGLLNTTNMARRLASTSAWQHWSKEHGAWSMSPAMLRATCVAGTRAEPGSLSWGGEFCTQCWYNELPAGLLISPYVLGMSLPLLLKEVVRLLKIKTVVKEFKWLSEIYSKSQGQTEQIVLYQKDDFARFFHFSWMIKSLTLQKCGDLMNEKWVN